MALSFLSAKALKIEVTEGVDLESSVFLTGDRVTVGTGPQDTLRLGSSSVVAEHVTFVRQPGAKNWEYFTTDRGQTTIDKGNPRTGTVRPGMWFRIGADTRIDILTAPAPDLPDQEDAKQEKKEVPLAVALPIMALMVVAFGLIVSMMTSEREVSGSSLRTAAWFVGDAALEPSLDVCLATGYEQSKSQLPVRVARTAPDALFQQYIITRDDDPLTAAEVIDQLTEKVRKIIAEAHLLAHEGAYLDASQQLRRLENVLPVGTGNCPILSAARSDLATLEIQAERR